MIQWILLDFWLSRWFVLLLWPASPLRNLWKNLSYATTTHRLCTESGRRLVLVGLPRSEEGKNPLTMRQNIHCPSTHYSCHHQKPGLHSGQNIFKTPFPECKGIGLIIARLECITGEVVSYGLESILFDTYVSYSIPMYVFLFCVSLPCMIPSSTVHYQYIHDFPRIRKATMRLRRCSRPLHLMCLLPLLSKHPGPLRS